MSRTKKVGSPEQSIFKDDQNTSLFQITRYGGLAYKVHLDKMHQV